VLSYDLALCYFQMGDREKALEYLAKAKPGTVEPKQREKLQQLLTHVTTGENGFSMSDSDGDRIVRVNQLADSIGLNAFLEDDGGSEEQFFEPDTALPKPGRPAARSDSNAGHRSSLGSRDRAACLRPVLIRIAFPRALLALTGALSR
jgi:hypothetical protein